jgi:hypothetical protein
VILLLSGHTVLKLSGFFKARWLVLQTEVRGLANRPTIVYAQLFYTRSRTDRAAKAADDRIRIRVGNRASGPRGSALVTKLPIDAR